MSAKFVSPPGIRLSIVDDYTERSRCDEGYLRVKRRVMTAHAEGRETDSFKYDVIERWAPDAVAILLYCKQNDDTRILLRSAIRPPLALRSMPLVAGAPFVEGVAHGELWEICAGIIEEKERSPEGIVQCACREVGEEMGIVLRPSDVQVLGAPFFPSAGMTGECIYLFAAPYDPSARAEPAGDGPLEQGAKIIELSLNDAKAWVDAGWLPDVKTELAIRRFLSRPA
jgi:ADP-ribose pyrophosphatase